MSEHEPFGGEAKRPPLGQESEASDFEIWDSLEGLKEIINHVLSTQPRSAFTGDQVYHAAFGIIVEEDELISNTGYEYEGEFVELVENDEDDHEPYIILKDVCCFVSPDGEYGLENREQFYQDTMYIARHTVMHVPISQFSTLLLCVRSKSEIEAEIAKYRSPADLL